MPPRPKKKTRHRSPSANAAPPAQQRLQKILAAAGLGSRRECEQLILEGRVDVDRQTVTELGTRVDPSEHRISVDGVALPQPKRLYYLINKPTGVVSTSRDPDGRPRVIDLIHSSERLFTVGRLDKSSEGLMLVTNDGELANQLTHPRYGIEKTYIVHVAGHPSPADLAKLRDGVYLAEGFAKVARIKLKRRQRQTADLEIVLDEGRNREIRRLLARIGHRVLRLRRVALGPIKLGNLPGGAYRQLTADELGELRRAVGRAGRSKKKTTKEHSRPKKNSKSPSRRRATGANRAKPSKRKAKRKGR